jgi:hypothetical protein
MTDLPEPAREILDEIGCTRSHTTWTCPECGDSVFRGDLRGETFECRLCCLWMQEAATAWGLGEILRSAWRGGETFVEHEVPGSHVRAVGPDLETVAGPLRTETVSKTEVERAIERHHRHHPAPHTAIAGVKCWEKRREGGRVLRGVASLATPTSRALMEQGTHLEVNRICTWGPRWRRQNVVSKMTAQLRQAARSLRDTAQTAVDSAGEASAAARRRAGVRWLRTYILDDEDGSSLRAGGWMLVGRSSGGSWARSRSGRTRRPETEGPKWIYDTFV